MVDLFYNLQSTFAVISHFVLHHRPLGEEGKQINSLILTDERTEARSVCSLELFEWADVGKNGKDGNTRQKK